jgi:hypothetical protein
MLRINLSGILFPIFQDLQSMPMPTKPVIDRFRAGEQLELLKSALEVKIEMLEERRQINSSQRRLLKLRLSDISLSNDWNIGETEFHRLCKMLEAFDTMLDDLRRM